MGIGDITNRGDSVVKATEMSSRAENLATRSTHGRRSAADTEGAKAPGAALPHPRRETPGGPANRGTAVRSEGSTGAGRQALTDERPLRQRRRPVFIAVGAVLVLVAALASYVTFTNMSTTVSVVVTTSNVARGEVIQADDLGTIEIAGGQVTSAVLASEAPGLVGQFATVDMPAGSLVTSGSTQPGLPVPAGMSIVGIAVARGQVPSAGLRAGDHVRVVSTPIAQGEPPIDPPLTIVAEVFATSRDERSGGLVVDVIVPSAVAADLAARSATGRIAIILDGDAGV